MNSNKSYTREAFYLPSTSGQLFCLYYKPIATIKSHTLFSPPFAEELNRSRFLMSQMASLLANNGHAVLLIDLYGTGDSEGDFEDSSWEIWKQNLQEALIYLQKQHENQQTNNILAINIIAIRLGALLAIDLFNQNDSLSNITINKLITWQPVFNGEKHLKQFMRLKVTNNLLSHDKMLENKKPIDDPQFLANKKKFANETMNKRELVLDEIAGYILPASLKQSLDKLHSIAEKSLNSFNQLYLYQITASSSSTFSPDIEKFIQVKSDDICKTTIELIHGSAFWQNYGVSSCTALFNQTLNDIDSIAIEEALDDIVGQNNE